MGLACDLIEEYGRHTGHADLLREAVDGRLGERRVADGGACAHFRTDSFATGARLVQSIAALPGLGDHAPDVDLRPDGVFVRLFTRPRRRTDSALATSKRHGSSPR